MKKFIPVILTAVILAAAMAASTSAALSPVVNWTFNNGDEGFTLTNVTRVEDSDRGYVLKFEGKGEGTLGASVATLTTNKLTETNWENGATVTLWVKADAANKGWTPLYNLTTYDPPAGSSDPHGFIGFLSTLEFAVNTTGNSTATGFDRGYTNPVSSIGEAECPISSEKWSQVVTVIGIDAITIYVDGVKFSDASINELTPAGLAGEFVFAKTIQLGSWLNDWWNGGDFIGYIDDVSIYNKGLTADEVAAVYNAEKKVSSGNTDNPVTADKTALIIAALFVSATVITVVSKRKFSER